LVTSLPSQNIAPAAIGNARLTSLDAFRGAIIVGMILVTDPGTYSAVYKPFLHAQWDGPTATDMIFPSFLVIVGIAIPLSFASRLRRGKTRMELVRQILKRSVILFLLGLLLNGFPDYNLHTIRIPGILQRIAICYLAGAMQYLAASSIADKNPCHQLRRRAAVIGSTLVFLLAIYWALLKLVPVPGFGAGRLDSLGNLGAYIDRAVFGIQHLWPWGLTTGYGVTFDPEGILSTLPALATLLTGVLAGDWLLTARSQRRKVVLLVVAGPCLVLVGLALSPWLPLNKKIWTSTFALFSGGVAILAFSAFYLILDIKHWRRWSTPLLIFGTNAILAFALSNIITTLTDRIHVTAKDGVSITLHNWLYQEVFATWLRPVHASLAYALTIVILNLALIYPLYRRRIFLRI
jgi:predicted acyltransferase